MRILHAILLALGFIALCVLTLVASGGWSPVRSQTAPQVPQCGPLEQALTILSDRYGEGVLFEAIANDGSRLIVTVKPDGTTWSAMTVDHDATACLRIVGNSWSAGAAPPPAGTEG